MLSNGTKWRLFLLLLVISGFGGCIRCVTPGIEKGGTLFSEFSSARWTVVLSTFREGKEINFTSKFCQTPLL